MDQVQTELRTESICPQCSIEMDLIKNTKKKNHFDKENRVYKCSVCGFTHRKRTLNEILRDLGLRDE